VVAVENSEVKILRAFWHGRRSRLVILATQRLSGLMRRTTFVKVIFNFRRCEMLGFDISLKI